MNTPRLLIIGRVWPQPRATAAGERMMQLIEQFQQMGYAVEFCSAAAPDDAMEALGAQGIPVHPVNMNSSTFDYFIKNMMPDAVLFDRFMTEEQFGWRVARQCPQAMRLLDTEDLHCLRRARQQALQRGEAFEPDILLTNTTAHREIAAIYRCDLTLMISEYEIELLRTLFKVPAALWQYTPFLADRLTKDDINPWPGYSERRDFVCIGNFRHAPNADAVRYLRNDIWPSIAEALPDAKMHVYGAHARPQDHALNNPKDRFLVHGYAENAAEVMKQARVCIAPVRFGAGLKGKLLLAMQQGTPAVTTPAGAEGMQGRSPWPGAVAEGKVLAGAAIDLYENENRWRQAQQWGIDIVNNRFSKNKHGSLLRQRIKKVREQLDAHRRENFTGAMLQHHRAAASKYMGRWITLKNEQQELGEGH